MRWCLSPLHCAENWERLPDGVYRTLTVKAHYRHRELVHYADTKLKVDAPYSHLPDLREAAQKAKEEIEKLFPKKWSEADFWRREKAQHRRIVESGGIQIPESLLNPKGSAKELDSKSKTSLS